MKTIEHRNRRQVAARVSASSSTCRIVARTLLLSICAGLLLASPAHAQDVSLDVGSWAVDTTTRTLPATLKMAVDLYTLTFDTGAGSLAVSVNTTGTGYSVAKRYIIPMRNNLWGGATVNTWLRVLPANDTGPFGANDFDLDIKVDRRVMNLRLRVTGTDGTNPGTAKVSVESTGVLTVGIPASLTPVAVTPPTAAQVFSGSVLAQINGRVGVNTVPSADAALDINGGDTKGLRIRPRTLAGAPLAGTGTWSFGTLIVDSTGALYLCTATGAPGTWKKVTP